MDNDKPVSREGITKKDKLAWLGNQLAGLETSIDSCEGKEKDGYKREWYLVMSIRSVLTSTPDEQRESAERGEVSCVVCGRRGRTIDVPRVCGDCLPQDARGEGESRQVGIVFKCKGCGRELEAFQKQKPSVNTKQNCGNCKYGLTLPVWDCEHSGIRSVTVKGECGLWEPPTEPQEMDTEWLLREVETAFFSMWSANYGVDTKKEKKALELIKKRLQGVRDVAKK